MSLDKTIPPLVLKKINKYGTTCVIARNSTGAYDPATAKVAAGIAITQTIKGLPEEYPDSVRGTFGDKTLPGTAIIAGDKKLMIAAMGLKFIPTENDKVQVGINGPSYVVISAPAQYSGELIAYYNLHIRKA